MNNNNMPANDATLNKDDVMYLLQMPVTIAHKIIYTVDEEYNQNSFGQKFLEYYPLKNQYVVRYNKFTVNSNEICYQGIDVEHAVDYYNNVEVNFFKNTEAA